MFEERFDVAETFFEDATCVHPDSYLAWTVLGKIFLSCYFLDTILSDVKFL